MTNTGLRLLIGVPVALLLFTSCTATAKDPTMTPDESKTTMTTLMTSTVQFLGSGGWSTYGRMPPTPCELESGDDAVTYTEDLEGPPSSDPEADVKRVQEFWKSKGLSTKVVHSTNPKDTTIRLYGTEKLVQTIAFLVDNAGTTLSAQSICVPGDSTKIILGDDY